MLSILLKKLDGSSVSLSREAILAALDGDILFPGSEEYEDARILWNAMIDRKPAFILRCRMESDIVKAVNFARERGLLLAVRAGGHNIAGKGLVEGGMVIDLQLMNEVTVDPANLSASVQPGATLAEVDAATQQHGLLLPTGINSTTGIAGLTLGGGFGWITRKYGLTIDNLRAVRLVSASGDILKVDQSSNSELFWALRGGGGNFGVVSRFEFNLHSGGPDVTAGMVVHALEDMDSVIRQYQQVLPDAPEELTCWAVMRKAPPLPFLPTEWHGREVLVLAMCYIGPSDSAQEATSVYRNIGRPIADMVGPMRFADWQSAFDPLLTAGARNYWKSHDMASFSEASIRIIKQVVMDLPSDESEIFFGHIGGAMTRVPSDATAWPNRQPHFAVNIHTRWREAAQDARYMEWARQLHEALAPHAMGSMYVNFIPEGDEDRIRDAYGDNYDRLRKLKVQYDPMNLFRSNFNIQAPETP